MVQNHFFDIKTCLKKRHVECVRFCRFKPQWWNFALCEDTKCKLKTESMKVAPVKSPTSSFEGDQVVGSTCLFNVIIGKQLEGLCACRLDEGHVIMPCCLHAELWICESMNVVVCDVAMYGNACLAGWLYFHWWRQTVLCRWRHIWWLEFVLLDS